MTQPLYTPRHKLSRYRGHTVAVLIRPSPRRRPNNVLCRDLASGDLFTCPWRGLRRLRSPYQPPARASEPLPKRCRLPKATDPKMTNQNARKRRVQTVLTLH